MNKFISMRNKLLSNGVTLVASVIALCNNPDVHCAIERVFKMKTIEISSLCVASLSTYCVQA